MIDTFILSLVVGADIIMSLLFRYCDINKATNFSSLELHMSRITEEELEAIIKKALQLLSYYGDPCPADLYFVDLDCEKRCNNLETLLPECWLLYIKKDYAENKG